MPATVFGAVIVTNLVGQYHRTTDEAIPNFQGTYVTRNGLKRKVKTTMGKLTYDVG